MPSLLLAVPVGLGDLLSELAGLGDVPSEVVVIGEVIGDVAVAAVEAVWMIPEGRASVVPLAQKSAGRDIVVNADDTQP